MATQVRRIGAHPRRIIARMRQELAFSLNWRFACDVGRLVWEYKRWSAAIIVVTIMQEVAALWPVNLLGRFVDGLQANDLGNVVWLFLGASLLYPGIVRANVILRHKMFYESDLQKRVELTLQESDLGECQDVEAASAAHTRVVNAVSGITNVAYHILGSFTPIIIKIIVVSGNLLAYNRMLGLSYLASLVIPMVMTVLFNNRLRVLRDAQYSVISAVSGTGVRVIAERDNEPVRHKFLGSMRERTNIFISLVSRSQCFLYAREITLVGSQFLVILLALQMRQRIGLTPGDFTRIVGYTTQVAVAFINTAVILDAIISHSRAYHIFAQAHRAPATGVVSPAGRAGPRG